MKTSFRFAFRSNFEACKKVWVCKLRLTWPRPRAVDRCEAILFDCMPPAMYRVSTGSAKPRSFHGALSLNQTKRLSTWRSVTLLISSAGNRDILSQQRSFAQTSFSPWTVMGAVRSIAQEERRLFPHASCTARTWTSSLFVRGFASNFSCSGNQESWENDETNRRLGMAVTPAMGIRVILVSPSEDSFEKGNQSLDFPHFSTFVHTL